MSSLPTNSDSDPVRGSRPVPESTPTPNHQPRGLRIARWCAAVPAALGVTASLGWLASGGLIAEVGWFYSLGLLAIGLGCVLLPVGLWSAIWAWWQGARQTSVVVALLLLLANLPLAAGCWGLASWVLDLHVVRISNNSTREIGPVRVWIEVERPSRNVLEISVLRPGESRVWSFHRGGEGSATFRAQAGERTWEATPEEQVFLGIGQPTEVRLLFLPDESYRFEGELARRWWWIHGLWH